MSVLPDCWGRPHHTTFAARVNPSFGRVAGRLEWRSRLPLDPVRMNTFGTPHSHTALKVLLLGSGELGKEVAIELQRFAVEVVAVDRYPNAPAMQVAHRSP